MPEVVNIQQYHDCATALEHVTGVQAADVIDQDPELDRPSIQVTVGPAYERVPPRVLGVIRDFDFGLSRLNVRGQPRHFVLVVA